MLDGGGQTRSYLAQSEAIAPKGQRKPYCMKKVMPGFVTFFPDATKEGFLSLRQPILSGEWSMNPKITIATLIFPLGLISIIAKPASAREMASLPLVKQAPLVLAQAYNNHREYDQHQEAREAARRDEIRRDEIRQNQIRQNQIRRDEIRRNEIRRDEIRRDEIRR